jgi:bifunctional DNA-binding transcriptional regulator/antitoxin component of YhaV-PrlF toxin-antitoxin module
MAGKTFDATLIKDDDSGGAGVVIPFDVREAFGKKGRVAVKCTIDGYPYRGSIVPYGGTYYIGVVKKIRDAIGKTYGDTVNIVMELDEEPRVVEVPEDFARALAGNAAAKKAFEKMSYSHMREYVEWINEAKKEDTRKRRIAKAVEKLLEK